MATKALSPSRFEHTSHPYRRRLAAGLLRRFRSMDADLTESLCARVRAAAGDGTPLAIAGGGTKDFLGRITQAERFDVSGHRGIVTCEPTELVLSARGGTPLAEVRAVLAEKGQMLAFEPPAFGEAATIGGAVAAGLSGPARPYAGAARDFVLGTRVLNGRGEALRFGGEVMKNVAGYDVSRLMTGAFGTLGVLLEVSLKVLPRPARVCTVVLEASAGEAIARCNAWAAKPLPITGACHDGEHLRVRLAGTAGGVAAAIGAIGGERIDGETIGDGEAADGEAAGGETVGGGTGGEATTARRSGRRSANRPCPSSPGTARRCGGCRCRPAPRPWTSPATVSSTGAARCAGCAPMRRPRRCAPPPNAPADTRPSFVAATAPARCSILRPRRC